MAHGCTRPTSPPPIALFFVQPALRLSAMLLLLALCSCSAKSSGGDAGDPGTGADAGPSCAQARCLDPTVQMCCDDVPCVDTSNDPRNCGGCDKTCPSNQQCVSSQCTCTATGASNGQSCAAGTVCCPDSPGPTGDPCTVLSTTTNCGACGRACNAGETCAAGECQCGSGPPCTSGQSCCGGACVEIQTDPNNCGGCSKVCMKQPGGGPPTCLAGGCEGECMPTCGALSTCCGTSCCSKIGSACCGNACVNTASDPMNCGKCGNVCPPWLGGMGQCLAGNCLKLSLGDGGAKHDM